MKTLVYAVSFALAAAGGCSLIVPEADGGKGTGSDRPTDDTGSSSDTESQDTSTGTGTQDTGTGTGTQDTGTGTGTQDTGTGTGTGSDTGTTPDTDEVVTVFGWSAGGGTLASPNYRCTLVVGAVPATAADLRSDSYSLRLGIGAQVNQ